MGWDGAVCQGGPAHRLVERATSKEVAVGVQLPDCGLDDARIRLVGWSIGAVQMIACSLGADCIQLDGCCLDVAHVRGVDYIVSAVDDFHAVGEPVPPLLGLPHADNIQQLQDI